MFTYDFAMSLISPDLVLTKVISEISCSVLEIISLLVGVLSSYELFNSFAFDAIVLKILRL